MTSNQSETAEAPAPHPLEGMAGEVATAVGGTGVVTFDTVKVTVPSEKWTEALTKARDDLGLIFFSFLSAIDWSNKVEVGDPLAEEVEERFEVLCTVGDLSAGRRVTFSTAIPKEQPRIDSLIDVYSGADWHEREAAEMFGIEFTGHPHLVHLYLPDGFEGHPLLKSFPLLSREVKPWPGMVDVEGMPGEPEGEEEATTENPEA